MLRREARRLEKQGKRTNWHKGSSLVSATPIIDPVYGGLRTRSIKSPLWKLCILEQSGEEATFRMEVVSMHSTCLDRQVHEMVRIGGSEAEVVLNSKSDFQQAPLVRLVTTTGLLEEQSPSQETGGRLWQELGQRGRGGGAASGGRGGGRGRGS